MLAKIIDWRQTLSWRAGNRQGRKGRPFRCPWWADDGIFALAYMQAKGVEIPKPQDVFPYKQT